MNEGFIYGLVCPIAHQVRYIGQTTNVSHRLKMHKCDTEGYGHKQNWIKSLIAKNLLDQLEVIILWSGDAGELDDVETRLIADHRHQGFDLVNVAPGGKTGCRGYHHSDEAKLKISNASRNRIVTDETKARLSCSVSKSLIGNKRRLDKKHSDKTRKLISERKKGTTPWNKGILATDEHRAHLSASKRGKKKPGRSVEHKRRLSKAKKEMWRLRREQGITGRLGTCNTTEDIQEK